MPAGRPRKPTAIAKLHGRPGKRALSKDEPIPPGKPTAAPPWLNETQAEMWNWAIQNAPPGVLTSIDGNLLANWCVAVDFIRQANIAMNGKLVQKVRGGGRRAHPLMATVSKQMLLAVRLSTEMGFTPASRPRYGTLPPPPPSVAARKEAGKTGTAKKRDSKGVTDGSFEDFLDSHPDALH